MTSVMWFRRDLRLADNPALLEAVAAADDDDVVPLFVLDPRLWKPAGEPRRRYLQASLQALSERIGGLQLRRGDPVHEVVAVARAANADSVHAAADFGPYGARRDAAVERALSQHGIDLVLTGSPYAVAPGRVRKSSGDPYQVFTAFARAWRELPRPAPVDGPGRVRWQLPLRSHEPYAVDDSPVSLPEAGELAALERWRAFLAARAADYDSARDRPDLDATSRMSAHLKWGEIHPRTMLAELIHRRDRGAHVYTTELAWRDFYADVLWHRPDSARDYLKPAHAQMPHDPPGEQFTAWQEGRTGYPIVDAGMRQLRDEGWMHNRVRMIVASFLVKDLHIEWQHGARHFLHLLVDGDLASNQHGWQWVAGCGTDAAPYFRVFNPVTQGRKFDPEGAYVRRYVPELREVAGAAVHQPWLLEGGAPPDYPGPIVDHLEERREALRRYDMIKASGEEFPSGTNPGRTTAPNAQQQQQRYRR
ncbi:MAG: DNA photolyase family protein [Nocardioides sp.]|nr:DNA photolyase family protein [Nocardioides sp.]